VNKNHNQMNIFFQKNYDGGAKWRPEEINFVKTN
jgi:hypothetical protein